MTCRLVNYREAAYLLNAYIEGTCGVTFDPPFLVEDDLPGPLNILELGSGTGIVAATIVERLFGQEHTVVVTDLPEVCPLLEQNLRKYITGDVDRPSAPKVLVRPLSWGSNIEAYNIAAELGCDPSSEGTAPTPPRHLTHVVCSDLVSTCPVYL